MFQLFILINLISAFALAQESNPIRIGSFGYVEQKDPSMDKNGSFMYTWDTLQTQPSDVGNAAIAWRCGGSDTYELFMAPAFPLGFDGYHGSPKIIWQFDQYRPSPTTEWPRAINGRAAFAPEEYKPSITDAAKLAKHLVITITYYDGETNYLFDLESYVETLKRLGCTP